MSSSLYGSHTTFYLRSELAAPHAIIDSALKVLKSSSRQLQTVTASFRDEMRILERLYYKGKNQHRTALFWRRVCELRRYGDRILRTNPDGLVESSRRLFWGPHHKQNPKLLKGTWTHFPDLQFVSDVSRRLSTIRLLCKKTIGSISSAFQHFSVCMQSGAFIQLILTLYAISARAHALVIELNDALDKCSGAYSVIARALKPESIRKDDPSGRPVLQDTAPEIDMADDPMFAATSITSDKSPTTVVAEVLFEPKKPTNVLFDGDKTQSTRTETKKARKRKKRDEIDKIFDL